MCHMRALVGLSVCGLDVPGRLQALWSGGHLCALPWQAVRTGVCACLRGEGQGVRVCTPAGE